MGASLSFEQSCLVKCGLSWNPAERVMIEADGKQRIGASGSALQGCILTQYSSTTSLEWIDEKPREQKSLQVQQLYTDFQRPVKVIQCRVLMLLKINLHLQCKHVIVQSFIHHMGRIQFCLLVYGFIFIIYLGWTKETFRGSCLT